MLKIGDFSKLARVTVKTLHHYEQMGLLHPAWIDRFSGYRYYSLEQLPRLNRILALKDLGFTLEEVAVLIGQNLSLDELRDMLAQKQAELELRVRTEQRRLEMVAVRLQQIERDESLSPAAVRVKAVQAELVAAVPSIVPSLEQVPDWSARVYTQMLTWLQRAALDPTPEWFTLHSNPEYHEGVARIETAAVLDVSRSEPVDIPPGQPLTLRQMPAVAEMASLVSPRRPVDLYQAYTDLYAWVEDNGYKIAGPVREAYLSESADTQPSMVEVQFPITRRRPWSIFADQKLHPEESKMELNLINLPAMHLVGMRYHGKNKQGEIAQMWNEFNQHSHEIPNVLPGSAYGVCRMEPGATWDMDFDYYAVLPVRAIGELPDGMVSLELPELKCVSYAHAGSLEKLDESYTRVYQDLLPKSGYERLEEGFDMEFYGEEFDPLHPDSVMYIYVPIK